MDDLDRIEAIYGCVAEYNRVREEEADDYREPTDEEIKEAEAAHLAYEEKLRILSGKPSPLAISLKSEWEARRPQEAEVWNMTEVLKWQKYSRERLFAVTAALCKHHGISHDEKMTLRNTEQGTFSISVEYHEAPYIKKWAVSDLDYEKFKALFRDLYYLGLSPTMCYRDMNGENRIVSNSSLGSLRANYLKWYGLEKSIEEELKNAGYDETAYKEKILKSAS